MRAHKTLLPTAVCFSILPFLIGGCDSSADSERKITELQDRVVALEKLVKEHDQKLLGLAPAKSVDAASITPTPSESPLVASTSTAVKSIPEPTSVAFTDISGTFGEKEIKDLVRIGVLDASSGKFDPSAPLKRAEFVSWLVKSNNALRPEKKVRPAEPGAKSTFPDLPTTHPFFKYVQGMADAGWSVGYEDKTFKPDKDLTREEMIGIKALFDEQFLSSNGAEWATKNVWSDSKKISKAFLDAMGMEAGSQLNWARVYGTTKNCDPQKIVTRGEGAACVWQIGRFPVNAGAKDQK